MSDLAVTFSRLSGFSSSEWAAWIDQFVNGMPVSPVISPGLDPVHLVLNSVYDQLPQTSKTAFSAGVAELLPAAQPGSASAERIYNLLQVAAHIAPVPAKALLLGRLTSECMRGSSFAGWDLHSLLLVVCSQFGVDQSLTDYIFHSVHSRHDIDYLVICFRMLLKRGPEITPFLLLEQILPEMNNEAVDDRVAEILEEALDRHGALPLLRWFEELAPHLKDRGVPGLEHFEEIVRQTVPWPENPERAKASTVMLAAWLHAPSRKFSGRDIRAVLNVLYRSQDHPDTESRLKRLIARLAENDPTLVCVDGLDETDARNRMSGSGDFVRLIPRPEAGDTDEIQLPRSQFHAGLLAILLSAAGSRTKARGRYGHRQRGRSAQLPLT